MTKTRSLRCVRSPMTRWRYKLQDSLIRGMQKHVEIDEPEETIELEPNLFGVAEEALGLPGDDIEEVDEEASDEDELAEDMLTVEAEPDLSEDSSEADPEENFEEQP